MLHHRTIALLAGAVLALVGCTGDDDRRDFAVELPDDGERFNTESLADLQVAVSAVPADDTEELPADEHHVDDVHLLVDGADATDEVEREGASWTWSGEGLDDGSYQLAVVHAPVPDDQEDAPDPTDALSDEPGGAEVISSVNVEVDVTPPPLAVDVPAGGLVAGEPVTITGESEPGVTVTVGDEETTADDDGRFEVELAGPPEGTLSIVATDEAGNRTDDELSDLVVVPSRARVDELRTVHVSFCGWASAGLREPVMAAVDDGRINAVQIDIKDESGMVGFATTNELAQQVGSDRPDCQVDLAAAVAELHEQGIPVVGRIVAFADPVLARWAWENDRSELAILDPDGSGIYTGRRYAGFGNPASPEVREYNIAIAEEAAALGVDHILWDYIRKPDGSIDDMELPGLEEPITDVIAGFAREADERLAPYGVVHGASLYGVSADRPDEVAQDVEQLAEVLDYVAPMVYPTHWGPGEYGVADPVQQAYDITHESLQVWLEATEGRRARVVPWLEDSNYPVALGHPDRSRYVREQLEAAYDLGIHEWLLWDSSVSYTDEAMIQPPD